MSLVVIVKLWKLMKEESKTEKSFGDSQNKYKKCGCIYGIDRKLFHLYSYDYYKSEN